MTEAQLKRDTYLIQDLVERHSNQIQGGEHGYESQPADETEKYQEALHDASQLEEVKIESGVNNNAHCAMQPARSGPIRLPDRALRASHVITAHPGCYCGHADGWSSNIPDEPNSAKLPHSEPGSGSSHERGSSNRQLTRVQSAAAASSWQTSPQKWSADDFRDSDFRSEESKDKKTIQV